MRRAAIALALGLALASFVLPQEPAGATETKHESEQGDPWIWWKWANFLLLAGGLGYMISKRAPALFQTRSQEIQQAIAEAAQAKKDAEARAAAIELRLQNLETEIDSLRQSARSEMAAEGDRLRRETEHRLRRIQEQSLQEIAQITRAARDELRKYSAQLAIGLAEQRIRSRMTPEVQQNLVDGFILDLRSRAPKAGRA
jgi:F-type H+-transporting ATPase subunit b